MNEQTERWIEQHGTPLYPTQTQSFQGVELYTGADPGFLERGSICIKGWGLALLILSHFS